MVKLTKPELENYRKYHIQGQGNLNTCKVGAILFSKDETIEHAISKSIGGIMIKKYGDIKFTARLIEMINYMSNHIKEIMGEPLDEVSQFITEAVPNREKKRRVDLVKLNDNTRFEFECSKIVKPSNPDGGVTVTIHI